MFIYFNIILVLHNSYHNQILVLTDNFAIIILWRTLHIKKKIPAIRNGQKKVYGWLNSLSVRRKRQKHLCIAVWRKNMYF